MAGEGKTTSSKMAEEGGIRILLRGIIGTCFIGKQENDGENGFLGKIFLTNRLE